MKVSLQFYSFSWPGGAPEIGARLARAVTAADDAGFASLWVMDPCRSSIEMGTSSA